MASFNSSLLIEKKGRDGVGYSQFLLLPPTTTTATTTTTTSKSPSSGSVDTLSLQSPSTEHSPLFNRRMLHSLTTSTYGDYDAIPNGGVVVVSDHNGDEEDKLTQDSRSEVASSRTPRYRKLPVTALAKEPFTVKCSLSCAKNFVYYFVYAVINVIIGIPSLYGYAAVIFNHEVFTPHMNTLSKLVIFSSLIHQLVFTSCSSLSTFAIGTVQDAGLIFLSSMANRIANTILDRDNGTEDEVISTVLVLLSLGTATLGLVLIAMGHFRLADAVSYLPMPVVGGYLAFIGYFCLEAGIGLAISETMTNVTDWAHLAKPESLLLAIPALVSGFVLTWLSRNVTNDSALPLAMVAIPGFFYFVIFVSGVGMEGAREAGWVGGVAPPVPVKDLFRLVDFSLVRWDLIREIIPTWVGMVFVVSFASCLDVAAISMDMGEALDTNRELATVGLGNFLSGLLFGFTGSYIFSQTIFTYRTGVHSRWIGVFIMMIFAYVVASPVNILQVTPLFFLGSTLIFIGYDLLYEWLFEIRDKIFLSEYAIVWATFIAIQVVGMDAGIVIGVLVAIVDHVVHSAKTTGVYRVNKKSRAVWTPEEHKILQDQGYHPDAPKIITLEVAGNVFFGSSLGLLHRVLDELGITMQQDETRVQTTPAFRSSHNSPFQVMKDRRSKVRQDTQKPSSSMRSPPKYLVLDLSRLHNLDASAARGCFLQLVKIFANRGITVCACGASVRIEWMLRSHHVAYDVEEEQKIKQQYPALVAPAESSARLLLFVTLHEALVFCENALIHQLGRHNTGLRDRFSQVHEGVCSLAFVFSRILGCSPEEEKTLSKLNWKRYHEEINMHAGQDVFLPNSHSDGFYVVLNGAVALAIDQKDPRHKEKSRTQIVSGAGVVRNFTSNGLNLSMRQDCALSQMVVTGIWPVGGIFGYVDFLLERPRYYRTVATEDGTVVAKVNMANLHLMQNEDPVLDGLVQRVLLRASLLDLANCTCGE